MRLRTWLQRGVAGLAGVGLFWGCHQSNTSLQEARIARYEQRVTEETPFQPVPDLTPVDAPAPVELSGPVATTQPAIESVIWLHIPDPSMAADVFDQRLKIGRYSDSVRREYEWIYEDAKKSIEEIRRQRQFKLTLADAVRRALANNYQIQVDGYGPAISTAQLVQAEAIFDAAFFANVNRNNTDRPTPSQIVASQTDTTTASGGIRKLLATGATATLTHSLIRVDNPGFGFQTINPSWTNTFSAELRQPTLRGFGIDFNRSTINIRKKERLLNLEVFRASVIQTLNDTERAYWDLVSARRDVTINAELLAQARQTLRQVSARADYDAYQTLLYQSQTQVEGRLFDYISVKNRVRTAEDLLLNLLNDPELPPSAEFEIIPVDGPTPVELVRDRFHEVETALEHRPEIMQARHAVDIARLSLGIAKNQALPQLDVVYRATFNGLAGNADRSFDQLTGGNFVDQFIGMEFAWNFGERAERAGIRVAALQQSQAVMRYKKAIDDIITDCRVALRNLDTFFEQVSPSRAGVVSADENLRSLHERQERKSPAELNTIFSAQSSLAGARRALLQALVAYNQGIVDVERAKGTLLEYNNITLAESQE